MKDSKNLILKENSTIKEALKIIDSGAMKIALIVDEKSRLIGTLSDGDIRRGFLNNLHLDDSIESIIFQNPTVCSIDDTKEKILEVALVKKVYQMPIVNDEGVLLGIEEVDNLIKPKAKKNVVVLMVGGLGTRLRPLTNETPKPLLKVGNKPILETIIESFSRYGFKDFILSINYKSEMFENYFGDGSSLGVNITYIHERKRLGTAGALSLMQDKLQEDFFVMNGDLLTNINFDYLLKFHKESDAKATMCVREYDFQVPYGVVEIVDGVVKSIVEKPIHKFFVSAGVYMLNPSILTHIPKDTFYDMPTLFEKLIELEEKTVSFPLREYWLDIGRIEEYEKANNEYDEVFHA